MWNSSKCPLHKHEIELRKGSRMRKFTDGVVQTATWCSADAKDLTRKIEYFFAINTAVRLKCMQRDAGNPRAAHHTVSHGGVYYKGIN